MNPKNFWKKYEFSINQTILYRIGFVQVWVKRIDQGWLLKTQNLPDSVDALEIVHDDDLEDGIDVLHYHSGKSNALFVVPALPIKSIVFRNNKNLRISAGEATNLFLRIPLNIQFYFQEVKEENKIFECPVKRLSDTWFGEIDNGEPAFSIGSSYEKSFPDVKPFGWEAILSVEIVNNTAGSLDLQRLILHVEEFYLYMKNHQLITSHATIDFKGQEQAGSVNLSVRKELHGEKAEIMAKPRNSDSINILRRSFFFIKNIYQN